MDDKSHINKGVIDFAVDMSGDIYFLTNDKKIVLFDLNKYSSIQQ